MTVQRIDAGGYEVYIGVGRLADLRSLLSGTVAGDAAAIAVISDSNVAPLYAEGVRSVLGAGGAPRTELFVVPAGEAAKSRREWAQLSDAMLARGLGRDTAVVALGGGVVGDLAGFVAATYMRGIPFVQVPTSLLAMVDASIGGKTAVDTPAGKNLIGAFHAPAAVIVDPSVLQSLPAREWRCGFAEIVKHGAIASAAHFQRARELAAGVPNKPAGGVITGAGGSADMNALESLIAESVRIKARVVAADMHERARRRTLNAGHTLGHAIEHASRCTLLHGEAVAIGLVLEATLGERIGVTAEGTAAELRHALGSAGLPVSYPRALPADDVIAATRVDKKARGGVTEYALLQRIGAADEADGRFSRPIADADVRAVLADEN
ncbi:MAG: 3-dehydroquinate synthase [Gemmatimonadaceae bacterium]